jgi:hypothetical protein
MKYTKVRPPWHAPPRLLLALAAVAATVLLHAGLLSLFEAQAPQVLLMATPQVERELAACEARADRHDRQRCRVAVAQRARQLPELLVALP